MSQNVQTHFKNLAAFAARFLKCVWPFWDIMYYSKFKLQRKIMDDAIRWRNSIRELHSCTIISTGFYHHVFCLFEIWWFSKSKLFVVPVKFCLKLFYRICSRFFEKIAGWMCLLHILEQRLSIFRGITKSIRVF